MVLKKPKFLLDENVPVKLKRIFDDSGIQCTTIKEEGWLGFKNVKLEKCAREDLKKRLGMKRKLSLL